MDAHQKKADKLGLTLVIEDESGFSFSPNCPGTWGEVGQTPILFETPGRHNHTGIGFITPTPTRHLLKLHFTIFKSSAKTEDFIFFLTELHYYCRNKVIIVWDNLSAHHAAETYFEDNHPDGFEFEYFPPHSRFSNTPGLRFNHQFFLAAQ